MVWLGYAHSCCSIVVYTDATFNELERWANAQRDGRPAEYRWRRLRKFRNSIPCTTPQSLANARCWSTVQKHCQYMYENARLGRKVNFAPGKILSGGKSSRKCIQCSSPGDGQTSSKVWLASGERRRCINEGKTRNR